MQEKNQLLLHSYWWIVFFNSLFRVLQYISEWAVVKSVYWNLIARFMASALCQQRSDLSWREEWHEKHGFQLTVWSESEFLIKSCCGRIICTPSQHDPFVLQENIFANLFPPYLDRLIFCVSTNGAQYLSIPAVDHSNTIQC